MFRYAFIGFFYGSVFWIYIMITYATPNKYLLKCGILEYNSTTGEKQFVKGCCNVDK